MYRLLSLLILLLCMPAYADTAVYSQMISKKVAPYALFTFIFDDANKSDITVIYPVFSAKNVVACSAIPLSLIALNENYMTNADIVTLHNAKWEILSHGETHTDMTTLSEADLRAELSNSITYFRNLGITITNLAYPYSASNFNVMRIVSEYYRSARQTTNIYNSFPPNTGFYTLNGTSVSDYTLLITYEGYVDTAIANNKWVIFIGHVMDANNALTIGALIDYIQTKDNVKIVTIEQALTILAGGDI